MTEKLAFEKFCQYLQASVLFCEFATNVTMYMIPRVTIPMTEEPSLKKKDCLDRDALVLRSELATNVTV